MLVLSSLLIGFEEYVFGIAVLHHFPGEISNLFGVRLSKNYPNFRKFFTDFDWFYNEFYMRMIFLGAINMWHHVLFCPSLLSLFFRSYWYFKISDISLISVPVAGFLGSCAYHCLRVGFWVGSIRLQGHLTSLYNIFLRSLTNVRSEIFTFRSWGGDLPQRV